MWKAMVCGAMAAMLLGLGMTAALADDKEAVIKHRRDVMKRQGEDFKVIQAYTKGEADQAAAQEKVNDLLTIAPQILDLFPAGTSLADFPGKTGAKPAIWTEWGKFKDLPAMLQAQEMKLADAIKGGDKAAVLPQLVAVGKDACGGCHTPYREKLE
ncbi:MAG TPA: cytochrome c [Stellaceae bacterium]|nr:cytochrome c [Stellaceae bacterium]